MFRWLSERYPLSSQLIEGANIPVFDNLYLDMNGIIHNATHANKGAHQVLSDKFMFTAIFSYIENLFEIIQPQKLIYMAVDGVAPRAKMNQQRARRFRTAMDREKEARDAKKKGVIVSEDSFDSNCITPGTEFMEKLTAHLKYFIHKKTSESEKWQKVEIILSSHEVPGEGEHKIMEYIRLCKAQPEYDPNLRHCLYGLDADLIMLGLLSHEPHFALLREEVVFGKQVAVRRESGPRFFLLHLSVVREYLEMDFVFDRTKMKFQYDLERVIDDFIMMVMFVGNDFLPHLPGFDIGEGVLTELFRAYSKWLITGDGYINDAGTINFVRLEQFLHLLDDFEYLQFLSLAGNENLLKDALGETKKLTQSQREIVERLQIAQMQPTPLRLCLPDVSSFKDVLFLKSLTDDLGLALQADYVTSEDGEPPVLQYTVVAGNSEISDASTTDDEEGDSYVAIRTKAVKTRDSDQVYSDYLKWPVLDGDTEERDVLKASKEYQSWRSKYYYNKMHIKQEDTEGLQALIQAYAEGIQWVMYYYYRGIPSWGWFYPYHYAPFLSDLRGLGNLKIVLEKGTPFKPFEQLMGVLPSRSMNLVPPAYRPLMTNPGSTIYDFYPLEFETDANGKKNDWEAVVLIPFIDQERLLSAMVSQDHLLTEEERKRNSHGDAFKFRHNPDAVLSHIPSTFPDHFPAVKSRCTSTIYRLPDGPPDDVFTSRLCPGVRLGADAPAGFPSLHTLPVTPFMGQSVQVFERPSRNESICLKVADNPSELPELAQTIGKVIFVGYPFFREGKVLMVEGQSGCYNESGFTSTDGSSFKKSAANLASTLMSRQGIQVGVKAVYHVALFTALFRNLDGSLVKRFEEDPALMVPFPVNMTTTDTRNEDPRFKERETLPLEEEFPLKAQIFFLGDSYYGLPGRVDKINSGKPETLNLKLVQYPEAHNLGLDLARMHRASVQYLPLRDLSKQLRCSPSGLSRITSSIKLQLSAGKGTNVYNVGLGLKFEGKGEMAVEYCRRGAKGWEFSPRGCALISSFSRSFPDLLKYLSNEEYTPIIPAELVYPRGDALEKIEAIREWLKAKGLDKIRLSPVGSESLEQSIVARIQAHWDNFYTKPLKLTVLTIERAPRSALLSPSMPGMQLGRQSFELGQRVISVSETSKAPLVPRALLWARNLIF
ncbi:exonuclease II Exo2 [Entomophthora muscae]|uniref:Exonuclease II Exo2 n=1 Tax=Entomophthora muscae TaxID=34485 RepID=A0ACC2SN91_9FUNG|nr:exonuclease II Exo2 [Entomophthora muscae]